MTIAYLNGDYLPLAEAKISPLDRGFLFGEGIYEVIPCFTRRSIGLELHIQRMQRGLKAVGLALPELNSLLRDIIAQLIERSGLEDMGIYIQISRGADNKRSHAIPSGLVPTVFAYAFAIAPAREESMQSAKAYQVVSSEDYRWKRCHIKSTSLLGNLLHFQQGQETGADECILFNRHNQLTEASTSNVFVVKNRQVMTPVADEQILSGITRHILLDILAEQGNIAVQERVITMIEVRNADELWLCSSTKGVVPVTLLDGKVIGSGQPGDMWQQAQSLYFVNKFKY